jgi:predicted dehydrogenase
MTKQTTRRAFLSRTAAAAGAGISIPYLVPAHVLPAPGRIGPNDKIVCGHIGLGGRGLNHLNDTKAQTIGVCDCDKNHMERAVKATDGRATGYSDYRKMLEVKEIDAIFIGAPDHWHALMTIHACQAGKDVYCEKPACNTIPEAKAMVAAVKKYERVVQIGSQGRSQEGAWQACTFIRNGMLGKVTEVNCWHPLNPEGGDPNWKGEPPAHLDWDFWLGPAKERPYNPAYHPGSFRWFLDLGGGNIRDRGAHIMSVALYLMNADDAWPVTVEVTAVKPQPGKLFDVPPRMEATYEFKKPTEWKLLWKQPGIKAGQGEYGAKYTGDKDTLIVNGGDGGTWTEDKAKSFQVPANGIKVFRSPGHLQNFFECMRTREKPIMHIEAGTKVATVNNMGNAAYLAGGAKLTWDPVKEKFSGPNCDVANAFLLRPARAKYKLPDKI